MGPACQTPACWGHASARGPQHFALATEDGALTGPFGVMVHEPALGIPLQELGSAVGGAVGLSDDELAALAAGRFTTTDPVEKSAYELCRRLLADRSRLTGEEYDDLVAALGTTTITELVVLVGYYRTLAQLLDVFDVGPPDR